ncbi:MAG: glycosyltransferase [Oscillospiraceae bacterium]|nr:glycosyltransferase [Oscillospiraceae bacterium]
MKPLVTIVIPVYNGESYLKEAINSALAQTYEPIEVIIVNDGSTDRTGEIALSYGDKIRYFAKGNGGVSTALNLGIANMRGEYFSWLSHDDLYTPDKIELQIAAIADSPERIAYSDYTVIDRHGAAITTMDIAKKHPHADLSFGLFPILRQVLNGCSLLIHKSHFARTGVFDESLRTTQDYDLWFKMLRGGKLVYINRPLVKMREHGAQVTHSYERSRDESDGLWLGMLSSVTAEEACGIDGSELIFWDRQAEFLSYTPYKNARLYARRRLKELGGGGFSFARVVRLAAYKTISGASRLSRKLGIQSAVRKSRVFSLGYKIWFRVRYR